MTSVEHDAQIDQLMGVYGDGLNGGVPNREQWQHVLQREVDAPVTLINFFRMEEIANYAKAGSSEPLASDEEVTGQDAFAQYAQVSMPALTKVGGEFLLMAPHEATLIGEPEDWDLIAIGQYPDTKALLALFMDPEYQAAFAHRVAACSQQKVVICSA